MNMVVNVKTVSRFKFETDDKKIMQGTKIFYEGQAVNTDTKKGVEILQMNSERYEAFNEFTQVPGKYEIEFDLVPGQKGQVKMQYVSCKLIEK